MREVTFTDPQGRHWARLVPEGAPDSDAEHGGTVGPVSLAPLGLPLGFEVPLHNELHARRIFTARDARKRRADIELAIRSALKLDTGAIVDLYLRDD